MKKIFLVLLLLLTGCNHQANNEKNDDTLTIVDDLGREVIVDHPQRVATLLGSYADIWMLTGGEIVASADDAWEDYDLPLSEDVINLGMTKSLNLEKIIEANPDLILASSNTSGNVELLDNFEEMNIPVLYFEVSTYEQYLRFLKVCCEITGNDKCYEENGVAIQNEIEKIIKQSQDRISNNGQPTVLSLRASSTYIRAKNSKNNILGEMLFDLGCMNIADNDESLLENLSAEQILKQDPDYIFFIQQGDDKEGTLSNINHLLSDNPMWSELSAVKEGRVYVLDKSLYALKPNARWGEAYEKLEEILNEK